MPNLIYAKIDVTKILKEHLFHAQSGAKYLDIVLIPSSKSQYGDTHMIVQGLPKELREKGQKGPIIGNAKEQEPKGESRSAPKASQKPTPPPQDNIDEDVPF